MVAYPLEETRERSRVGTKLGAQARRCEVDVPEDQGCDSPTYVFTYSVRTKAQLHVCRQV